MVPTALTRPDAQALDLSAPAIVVTMRVPMFSVRMAWLPESAI